MLGQLREGVLGAAGGEDLVAVAAQHAGEGAEDVFLVIQQQQGLGVSGTGAGVHVGRRALVVLVKELLQLLERHGAGEVVALEFVAMALLQEGELGLAFHPFGDHPQAQVMGHGDDALGDRGVVAVADDFLDEGSVDLHLVDGQALQVVEAGETGAEVVDGQAHPEGLQRLQGGDGALGVVQQHGFGDLQFQQFGG
ncbi:hypothetical protein D9M71_90700 [compost metagenome]